MWLQGVQVGFGKLRIWTQFFFKKWIRPKWTKELVLRHFFHSWNKFLATGIWWTGQFTLGSTRMYMCNFIYTVWLHLGIMFTKSGCHKESKDTMHLEVIVKMLGFFFILKTWQISSRREMKKSWFGDSTCSGSCLAQSKLCKPQQVFSLAVLMATGKQIVSWTGGWSTIPNVLDCGTTWTKW